MSEPLDLGALEARLKFGDSLDATECMSLLIQCRALRAALGKARLFMIPLFKDKAHRHDSGYVSQYVAAGIYNEAARYCESIDAVLARVRDAP